MMMLTLSGMINRLEYNVMCQRKAAGSEDCRVDSSFLSSAERNTERTNVKGDLYSFVSDMKVFY